MSEKKKEEKKTVKKTKPKTKAKATSKKEAKVESLKEEVVEEVKEPTPTRRKSIDIELNSMICLRSVTKGGLTYISPKTGMQVTWGDYGDEEYLDYGEILTMKSSKGSFLNRPFVIVDDEEVAEKLGLTKMYNEMINLDSLDSFHRQSIEDITKQIEKSPKGIKKLIGDKAREQIQNGELVDIRKIKLLEDKLKIELSILID